MFKPTKFCLIEDDNLKTQVKKENIKKISEKKPIFESSSLELGTILTILQKINYLAQK